MANRSGILDVLPLDIVELVVREGKRHGSKDLCGLRLVCKALNELVEPEVFSTVSIRFTHDDSGKWKAIPEFLSSLASGRSPYVRWARELRLNGLIGIQPNESPWSQYDPWQGEERETMLACQKELLVPAIESLVQVEAVNFVANSWEPYQDVFSALAKLPRLRDLSVIFYAYSAFENVPFAGFSNLNRIWLTSLPMTPHIIDGVKGLLARSPSLTELGLNASPQVEAPEAKRLEFSSLVEDAMKPNFSPRLKELSISPSRFNLSPSCAPFLRSLTSLVIPNGDSSHTQPSFWKALQDSGIHLRELKVAPLRQPIIDYLLSYSGLRDFTLDWSRQDVEDVEKIARQFFHAVLPRHRDTIRSISFGHTNLGPWTVSQSDLDEGVYPCKNLQKLTLIYYFPSPNEKHTQPVIPLGNLFSGISDNLPRLETLRLEHTRKFQRNFGCGFACGQYFNTVGRAFVSHVSKSQFSAKRKPQFSLDAAARKFISKPVSTASSSSASGSEPAVSGSGSGQRYRFDLLSTIDDVDLQLDEDVYDCDAYSGDEGFY